MVQGRLGYNSLQINGEYVPDADTSLVNGHPVWVKRDLAPAVYIVMDACGSWLISERRDGGGDGCVGLAYGVGGDGGGPWRCQAWRVWQGSEFVEDPHLMLSTSAH